MSYSHSTAVCFRAQRVDERTTVSLTRRSETVKLGLAPRRYIGEGLWPGTSCSGEYVGEIRRDVRFAVQRQGATHQ